MHWIDWALTLIPIAAIVYIGWALQKHMKGVSDFLAAGRVAGRYLVSVAGMMDCGIISIVAIFEKFYRSGAAIDFWGRIATPVGLVMTLTGFVTYRFRETRAMTMAQFFEMRYSRSFRVFAGIIIYVSGVLNYALFPAVSARFLLYFCGLPETWPLFGLQVSTYATIMVVFLSAAVAIVWFGGQLTAMVTDCVQGLFSYVGYLVIVVAIMIVFSTQQFGEAMMSRPPGESFLNPFDTEKLTEFNIFYVIIGIMSSIYSRNAWLGSQAYMCSAASAHEQKMGGVLSTWRGGYTGIMISLLAVAGFTFMNHPDFGAGSAAVQAELAQRINCATSTATNTLREQMTVPMAMRHFLPTGVMGLMAGLAIIMWVSTDQTYLHSWGSIFIQDIVLPLKRKPFTPHEQIRALRLSILAVAIFGFLFSLYFAQTTYILMFFALTGTIWLGGAGSAILGGLYWRKGTTAGAYAALITGSSMGVGGFMAQQYWGKAIYPWLTTSAPDLFKTLKTSLEALGDFLPCVAWKVGPDRFPLSGQEIYFLTMVLAIVAYLVFSLLTCREKFNLERMLHRGKYARAEDQVAVRAAVPGQKRSWLMALMGIDEHFTLGDKILAWSVFLWSMLHFAIFLVVIAWNVFFTPWSTRAWFLWWKYYTLWLGLFVGGVTTVWFTWGGTRDLLRLLKSLKELQRNVLDDGRVIGHVSADDVAMVEAVEHVSISAAHEAEKKLQDALVAEEKRQEEHHHHGGKPKTGGGATD